MNQFNELAERINPQASYQLAWEVAERLEQTIRGNDILYRIDIKRFAIILDQINNPLECGTVARKLLAELDAPFNIDGQAISIGCHLGIHCDPRNMEEDIQAYFHKAYRALLRAEEDDSRDFCYFNQAMEQRDDHQLAIIDDLKQALPNQEFSIDYRPIMDLERQQLQALELLVRWNHPSIDIIGETAFIPLAEKAGIMADLVEWQLHEVDLAAKDWPSEYFPQIVIKISAFLLLDTDFIARLHESLKTQHIPDDHIVLAIREHNMMTQKQELMTMFHSLDTLNCRVCIEDFGKGHLSVNDLAAHRIRYVKIANDFSHDMVDNAEHYSMIKALIAMVNSLDMRVIGTQIEDRESVETYKQLGCHLGCGRFFGETVPVEQMKNLIQNRRFKLIQNK